MAVVVPVLMVTDPSDTGVNWGTYVTVAVGLHCCATVAELDFDSVVVPWRNSVCNVTLNADAAEVVTLDCSGKVLP